MLQAIKNYTNSHQMLIRRIQYFLIGLFVFLIFFDIYLAVTDSITISEVIKDKTDNGLFVLTYFWGALAVNLFITRKNQPLVNGTAGSIIIIGIALMIIILDLEKAVTEYFSSHNYEFSKYLVSMSLGLLAAILFWRQKHEDKTNASPQT